jgi:hypothetical protein
VKKYSAGLPLFFASASPEAIERHLIGSLPGAAFEALVSDREGPGTARRIATRARTNGGKGRGTRIFSILAAANHSRAAETRTGASGKSERKARRERGHSDGGRVSACLSVIVRIPRAASERRAAATAS